MFKKKRFSTICVSLFISFAIQFCSSESEPGIEGVKMEIIKEFDKNNRAPKNIRQRILDDFPRERYQNKLSLDSLKKLHDLIYAIGYFHESDSLERTLITLNEELQEYGVVTYLSGYIEKVWRTTDDVETYLVTRASVQNNGKYISGSSECLLTLMDWRFSSVGTFNSIPVFKNYSESVKMESGFTKELPGYVAFAKSTIKKINNIDADISSINRRIEAIKRTLGYEPTKGNIINHFKSKLSISATAISDTKIRLKWTRPSGFDGKLIIDRDSGNGFKKLASVSAGKTEFTDKNLDYGKIYKYRIDADKSSSGLVSRAYTSCKIQILRPQGFVATAISDSEIHLIWEDACDFEAGFKIERDDGNGFTEIGTVTANAMNYTDTGLSYGDNYIYRVAGYTTNNVSGWTTSSTVSTTFPAPTNLTVSAISDSEIALSWSDSCSFEEGFRVERDGGNGFVQVAEVTADAMNFTDSGLTTYASYDYRILAFTIANNSDYSATTAATAIMPMVDIDGNVYKIVKIGNQIWMAENLRVTHYRDGIPILNITDADSWTSTSSGAYCFHYNEVGNLETFGGLYNWYAVDDLRGVAPEGWHVPTDREWKELEMYLGMSQSEADGGGFRGSGQGRQLAGSAELWEGVSIENNTEFGSSSFNALPGGYRSNFNGSYPGMGYKGNFWSATENGSDFAWIRWVDYHESGVARYDRNKGDGYAIRCLRD